MGQRHSSPAPPPPPPPRPTPPPPPTPEQLCALRKVELNQVSSDLKAKQTQVDSCDPTQAQQRKTKAILDENNKFIGDQLKRLKEATQAVQNSIQANKEIKEAVQPLLEIQGEINTKYSELEKKNEKLQQGQRQQRRNFMDSDPQGSLNGIPGLYTTDDRVMLAFWLTFLPSIILMYITIIILLNVQWDTQGKITNGIITLGTVTGLTYYLITQYA
jgi:hypothetical protein